jgi:hypothetical protein
MSQYLFYKKNKCCLRASVDTEMCCPKGKCGCQYFILLTLKSKHFMDTGVLDLNLLFINLLLMIQFYIPWEGEGGYDENLK